MKHIINKLLSLLPTPLPVGITEFEVWAKDIIELGGNYADEDSMKYALASMVIHLGPQRSSVPKNHFVRSLRKAAANQVASQVFQDIKHKQDEAQKALQVKPEDTTPVGSSANEEK